MDIREYDARAVLASVKVVSAVTADRLDLPTPCAGWTLGDLLAHMTGQHYGFAAAAGGEAADRSVWRNRRVDDDPVGGYTEAAERVVAAFADNAVLTRGFWLPEIRGGDTFPAAQAISFHFVDYVVHSWDVAAAVGVPLPLDDDLVAGALKIAARVPDGEARLRPGAAFRPGLPVGDGTPPLHRLLALLGRSPSWPD
jgi:uncharacterized protein (TIGR03086 family)